jgi:hypothetical protein
VAPDGASSLVRGAWGNLAAPGKRTARHAWREDRSLRPGRFAPDPRQIRLTVLQAFLLRAAYLILQGLKIA